MNPLAPNTMVQDRYLIVHLIGKGGMGEVYLAVDQRLGSAVAVKRTSYASDPALAGAFEREARILARLRHPVLPKVSDHFIDGGNQFLVMEHIAGDDLSTRLEAAGKAFPLSWVMFWADQLLDALNYLHSHEPPIIHRDIKPQNLKLTDENHIILLDFGLSKDTENPVRSETGKSGSIFGYTPHFAPMEQIRGTGTDPRSDIYALSATLYQLLTNVKPADALTRADAMLNGKPDPVTDISTINPEISTGVSAVLMRGLEITKDKRFASAAEMQRALRTAYSQMKDGTAAAGVKADAEPEFDKTLQMSPQEVSELPRQADVKTQVLLGDEMREEMEKVAPEEPTGDTPFDPAATVPLISLEQPPAAETPSVPAAPAFFADEQPAPAPEAAPPPTPNAVEQPKPKAQAAAAGGKKPGSKAGLFLGGLAALFLLLLAGGAAAWYIYSNYAESAQDKPTPTPTPMATPEATPALTPEPTTTPDANVNGNTASPTPVATPTPFGNTPTPTPQLAGPPKEAPVKTVKTPTAKAPPKPKPNNDRTVILQ